MSQATRSGYYPDKTSPMKDGQDSRPEDFTPPQHEAPHPLADRAEKSAPFRDGIINLNTGRGDALGFTPDKYEGYLWKDGDSIVVSSIVSKQRGNFRELVQRIHALGLTVKVPTPVGRMKHILIKNGYKRSFIKMEGDSIEVWSLVPPK